MVGVSATDKEDGDLTSKVMYEGTVDTSRTGTFEIKYSVRDSVGNEVHTIQEVFVKDKDTGKTNSLANNSNSNKMNLHIKSFPIRGAVQLTVQQWDYGWLL